MVSTPKFFRFQPSDLQTHGKWLVVAVAIQALTLTSLAAASSTPASWADDSDDESFQQVGQIFARHCLSCHDSRDPAAGLSLETADDLRAGGYLDWDGQSSELLTQVTAAEGEAPAMPKDALPLSAEEVHSLVQWLEEGAPWPDDFRVQPYKVKDFDWWSWQPVAAVDVPEVPTKLSPTRELSPTTLQEAMEAGQWIRNPIDAFIWEKLAEHGLRPNPPADRRTLIRRLTYDLTGLPPTPAEIEQFMDDPDPQAYEQLVDRLLESPHYGERWGRHWLDVARYADTHGYDKDKPRLHAWPYRDYVIRSFNQDKPYARFVQEQIAGDVLFPDTADGVLGLGFLAAGPWDYIGHVEVPETKIDGMEARHLDRDEMVSATFNVFCSVTVQCARCHHHKFDPISLDQYYGLQAVFAAVDRADRPYEPDPVVAQQQRQLREQKAAAEAEIARIQREMEAAGSGKLSHLRRQVAELEIAVRRSQTPHVWPDTYGFHSQLADQSESAKWVQLQWSGSRTIEKIVIYPCHDDFADIGAGFGFPQRLELNLAPDELGPWETVAVLDASDSDNDGSSRQPHQPWVIRFPPPGLSAQRLRLTATRLAPRDGVWIMALAEVEVWDEQEQNIAPQADLDCSDSIEAAPRWRLQNLTDGLRPIYREQWTEQDRSNEAELAESTTDLPGHSAPSLANDLDNARAALAALERELLTVDRQRRLKAVQQRLTVIREALQSVAPQPMVFAAATNFAPEGSFRPTGGEPRSVSVLHRGNVTQPLGPAIPGRIPLFAEDPYSFPKSAAVREGDRRAALATWITQVEHPLTWRSIVNRIWSWHFGRGIVPTPNDFGRMGQPPSHPELLDWMANQFRQHQSFKTLNRLIVTSSTYRQSSGDPNGQAEVDSQNAFYWRFQRRRLYAEEIRDSLLSMSGRLDRSPGGPGYYLFALERPEHSPHYEYHKFDVDDPATHRRSVYRFVVRSQPDPWMTTLDMADCSLSVPLRDETLTPMQALSLLNNDFTLVMAQHFADELQRHSDDLTEQIEWGFYTVTARRPAASQLDSMRAHAQQHGLASLCRVWFNLSEFVFVD